MNRIQSYTATVLFISCVLSTLRCTSDVVQSAGNGSQTPNPAVVGAIQLSSGEPAPNVKVIVYSRNFIMDSANSIGGRNITFDSTYTDSTGTFGFDSLDRGVYVFEGDGGSDGLAIMDSIAVPGSDSQVVIPTAKLTAPGAIKGTVRLSEGSSPNFCFILALGLDRYTEVDSAGAFVFGRLAEGTYALRFITTDDGYGSLNLPGVKVKAGDTTSLADTVFMPYRDLPAPRNVTVTYDTLAGLARVSWAPVANAECAGYIVYRNERGTPIPVPVSNRILTDTFFIDTVFRNMLDTRSFDLEYRVKSLDKGLNTSQNYSMAALASAPSPTAVRTFITMDFYGSNHQFCVQPNDTLSVVIAFDNKTRINDSVALSIDNKPAALFRHNSLAGTDTMRLTWTDYGTYTLSARVFDAAGSVWSTPQVKIRVKPIWTQVSDSAYGIHPRLSFTVGSHAGRMWIIGGYYRSVQNPIFVKYCNDVCYSSDGRNWIASTLNAPFTERKAHAFLSFNNEMWVIGGRDKNDVWSSPDGIQWTLKSSHLFGTEHVCAVFKNKMWKIGAYDEQFEFTRHVYYSTDGISWQGASDIPFSARLGMALVVFDEKMWIIHGQGWGGQRCDDIWNTSDGFTWTKVNTTTCFSYRYNHAAAAYDGKMWVLGGYNPDTRTNLADIWCTSDGISWTLVDSTAEFGPRSGHTAFVHDSSLYVCGGQVNSWAKMDMWRWTK